MPEPTESPAPQPRLRSSIIRGLVAAVILGSVVAGVSWFLGGSGRAGTGQPSAPSANSPAPRVGKEAPDFQVRQLDGTVARLSDFRGRPVWLSFWATWCPPCRAESAEIEAVSRTYGPSGLVVLAVDIGEDQQAVESYVQRAQLTYLIGFDPGEQIAALYRVSGLPNHFFIDAAGVLREWRVGPVEREGLAKSLTVILPAGVPAPPAN